MHRQIAPARRFSRVAARDTKTRNACAGAVSDASNTVWIMHEAHSIPAASTGENPAYRGVFLGSRDASAPTIAPAASKTATRHTALCDADDAPSGLLVTAGLVVLLLAAIAAFGGPEPSTANAADQRPRATLAPLPGVARGRTLSQRRAAIIRRVFGKRYGGDAVTVARCESRLDPRARNGQYRGVFQMGSAERARYGHGSTVAAQARAARRYFNASGRDWSPWSCKP